MSYQVEVTEDGIVNVATTGDLDESTARRMIDDVREGLLQSPQRLILVDLTEQVRVDAKARSHFRTQVNELTDPNGSWRARVCLVGGTPFTRALAKFVTVTAMRQGQVVFKSNESEARQWLQQSRG